MKLAYTICSANYLPYAKSLADSVIQHNPDFTFIIALADTFRDYDSTFFSPHSILTVTDMELPFFEEMNERYNIFELSCALKPYVAEKLFQTYPESDVAFYFDSDILVYHSLNEAEEILQTHPLVITPHISSPLPYQEIISTELDVLRTGLYNAGFFGLKKSEECFSFLNWWKERMRYHSFNDAAHGLFVDQLWLDLVPLYFKKSYVLLHPGYNMAYWNFSERRLTLKDEQYYVNETFPLVFFHFSGHNIFQPESISIHQKKHSFEALPEYQPLYEAYRQAALKNNQHNFFALPVTLGKQLPIIEEIVRPLKKKGFFKRKFDKLFKSPE